MRDACHPLYCSEAWANDAKDMLTNEPNSVEGKSSGTFVLLKIHKCITMRIICMRLQLGNHHNDKRFDEVTTCTMKRAHRTSCILCSQTGSQEKRWISCAISRSWIVFDCMHWQTSQLRKKSLNRITYENLIIMAIISSDLHFSVFFCCSSFVPFSLSVVPLFSQKAPSLVSFRSFYKIFAAHFASTRRLVAIMCRAAL